MVLVEFLEAILAQPPQGPQGRVERTRGVSLGKNELIIPFQNAVMQSQEQVERRKIAPQMPDSAVEMHLEQSQFGSSDDRFQWVVLNFEVGWEACTARP